MAEDLSRDTIFINKLNEVIDDNLNNEQFGVEELAGEIGMSRSHLHRKMQAITHQSISRYVRQRRLQRAMKMLQADVGTISEISYKVGFSSATYFNKCFHEYYGFPPGEVKKRKPCEIKRNHDNEISEPDVSLQKCKCNEAEQIVVKYSKLRKASWIVGGFIVIFSCLFFLYPLFSLKYNEKTENVVVQDKSIAILPFKNLSEDKSNQYFASGVMEDIRNRLTNIKDIRVISRISSDKYESSAKLLPQIAEELGVSYILQGSVQKSGNRVRVAVNLNDARKDVQLWSEIYDRELTDIFAIQTEISSHITDVLEAKISPQERARIEYQPTKELSAYDFYLKGREAYNHYKIRMDELDLETAIQFYKQALELDTNLAVAYSGLAVACIGGQNYGRYNYGCSQKMMDLALAFSNRALTIDPNLCEAYIVNGIVYNALGKSERSKNAYEKAVKINPNSADAYEILGFLAFVDKKLDVQFQHRKKALELDPASAERYVNLGYTCLFLDCFEHAEMYFQKAIKLQPDYVYAYGLAGNIYLLKGELEKSLNYFEKQLSYNPDNLWSMYHVALVHSWLDNYTEAERYFRNIQKIVEDPDYKENSLTPFFRNRLAYVLWKSGQKEEAMVIFDQQLQKNKKSAGSGVASSNCLYGLAGIIAFLNEDVDEVYSWLDKAVNSPGILFPYRFILNDPLFENIRSKDRFQRIINTERERISRLRNKVKGDDKINGAIS